MILAAGLGRRFGSTLPKQFMSLAGTPVIQYSINALKGCKNIDYLIIVTTKEWKEYCERKYKVDKVVIGGKTRTESVHLGLKACPKDTRYVVFHDANRPMVTANMINRCFGELKRGAKAVATMMGITDSLVAKGLHDYIPLNRDIARLVQTPEAFDYRTILSVYGRRRGEESTAISFLALEQNVEVESVEVRDPNPKITYEGDIERIEGMMKYKKAVKRVPDLVGKYVLLLGASGGIGSAILKKLQRLGAVVSVPPRSEVNLSNPFLPRQLYDINWDCIIHSAGVGASDKEGILEKYDEVMNVNLKSVLLLVDLARKTMIHGGNIVVLGSSAGTKGRADFTLYSASKTALNSAVESLAPSLAKENIRINCVCPGRTYTRLQKRMHPEATKSGLISPEYVAKIVVGYADIEETGNVVYIKKGLDK